MSDELKCPRCGATKFEERDAGPDSYEDDIAYTAYDCVCGLTYSGWTNKWYLDRNEEEEFVKVQP